MQNTHDLLVCTLSIGIPSYSYYKKLSIGFVYGFVVMFPNNPQNFNPGRLVRF